MTASSGGRRLVVETDGGSRGNPGPAGYGAVVRDADTGEVLAERADYLGVTSNNVAEYSGLIAGLTAARQLDPGASIEVRMDSRLVVEQMSGTWQIKHADMRRLAQEARTAAGDSRVTFTWVPRGENAAADALANAAMDRRGGVVRDRDAALPGPDSEPEEHGVRPLERRPSGAPIRFDDAEPVTVVLVRHGETPLTVSKAYSGSSVPGPGLTDRGRAQAARAAELVHRVGRDLWGDVPYPSELIASPMVRTRETAAIFAARLGLDVRTDRLVAECDFGEWEGLAAPEIEARWPGELRRWHEDASVKAPGGESIDDVGTRMRAGLAGINAAGGDRTVVVITHSVSVRAAVGVAIGAQSSSWARIRVAPASVSIIRLFPDGTSEVSVVGCPSET